MSAGTSTILVGVFLWTASAVVRAEEVLHLDMVGVRTGASATSFADSLYQVEVFCRWSLPVRTTAGPYWRLSLALDASSGCLFGEGEQSYIGTVGPSLLLRPTTDPIEFDVGFSPTLLSRNRFDDVDFGSLFQITSHFGLNWHFKPHVTLGYRFQHMSNGGLAEPNPGFNLHCLTVGYRF